MRCEHLQRDGALPGDDLLVVVGMHHGQAALLGQLERMRLGLVESVAVQDHLGAVARVCSTFTPGV